MARGGGVPRNPQVLAYRNTIARAGRADSKSDPAKIEELRRLLETQRVYKAQIKEALATGPLLTQSVVDGIVALLRPTDGDSK
ncbi:hypothetical protein AB0323_06685 [Arthrobacter sp. NPDC080031]|uniref:hypothetical protein n=1 Tax=Arthrobacter sp. NPDC080031 TaxID=3155918 RepID=UPI00344D9BCC